MISENTLGRVETCGVSVTAASEVPPRRQHITTTGSPTLDRKHTGAEERPARQSCQDFGTGGASTPGDASEAKALPGSSKDETSPQLRVRRRSVLPPKPKPPPVSTPPPSNAATGAGSTRRFCVQPCAPSPRMSGGSPPMARTTALPTVPAGTPPSPSLNCVSGDCRAAGDEPDGKAAPVPVPPPRRKKPKSPGTTRSTLVRKPDPPAVVATQPTAATEAVKPPVATPRRSSSTSLRNEDKNGGRNGESVGISTGAGVLQSDSGASVSGRDNNVPKHCDKQDQRKETDSNLPGNNSESTTSSRQGTSVAGTNPLSTNGSTTANNSMGTHPPIPPRLRKKARGTGSPASSPKPSRGRILPQTPKTESTTKNTENFQTPKTASGTNGKGPAAPNKNGLQTSRDNSSAVNDSSTTNAGEGETTWRTKQQQTTRLKDNSGHPSTSGSPPSAAQRRSTLGNRPTPLPPKPAPPPKSEALRQRSFQRRPAQRPPIPRPRSFIPPQTQVNLVTAITLNRRSSDSPPQKSSPVVSPRRGLVPATRTLAKSSPSVLAAVCEGSGISSNGAVFEKVVGTPPRPRKAGSESPRHVHGRRAGSDSVGRATALNKKRAIHPKSEGASPSHVMSPNHVLGPSHVTDHVSTPSHVTNQVTTPSPNTSHVNTPSHVTDHVSTPSHVTSHVSTPSHVTSHVSTPSHVASPSHTASGERRGSSSSASRVRVLPSLPQQRLSGGSLSESNRTKSLSNILNLPCSPAKDLPEALPPKPPAKRTFSKSPSVADILDMKDEVTAEGSKVARDVVRELKRVRGDEVAGEEGAGGGGGKEGGVSGEELGPEGVTEPHRNLPEKRSEGSGGERTKRSRLSFAKQRAVSVGDISLLETGPIQSDSSSYTSSEGRASVMSSESPLLERARQLSKNRKWCNQPEVKETGIVPNLAKEQLLQQEAIFEIITSEASYHLNLTTLIDRFMDDPKLDPNTPESVLDRTQHSMIFSNVKEIRSISARFLEEILNLFSEDIFLGRIFPVLQDYAMNRFVCYERYCASQSHRLKELRECTEKSENFQRQLKRLEEEANQTLQSLVTAPMQRVTKLPLLMSEVLKRTPNDDPRRGEMELTRRATEEIADLCNKGAGKIGDLVHLETIWKKLHFGQLKPFLMLAPGRKLKKEGPIDRLKVNKRKTRVQPDRVQNYLFVFTDLFMITTEEKERHHVVDYCPLNRLTVEPIAPHPTSPPLDTSSSSDDSYTMAGALATVADAGEEHAFLVSLQESAAIASGKQGVDNTYIFVVRSEAEKTKWMDILRQTHKEELVSTPKALTGRNLTLLTRKRQREIPTKKYWWKQPEVEQSGVVKTLTQLQLELQEAIFEVVTSEEEHMAAMETLVNHYMLDSGLDPRLPAEQRVLSEEEYNDIFRYVKDLLHISEGLLKTLHARQRESVVVDTICDIILLCVERRFQGYIRYCTNLPNSLEQLDSSIEKNESFRGYLRQLEEDQRPLRSLLKAPMERVTQLPHLMRTILRKTPTTDLNHCLVEATLRALEKVEKLCTSGQQKVEKIKELYLLESQLDFGNTKPFSLVSVGRSLLKQGSLTKLKVTQWFGKAVRKKTNYLIILSDFLLITKRIENVYKVMDMAPLDRVLVEVVEPHAVEHNSSLAGAEDALAGARWAVSKAGENHAFLVTLPDVKRSYTFVTKSEQERGEWMESLTVQNLMSFEDETDSCLTWEYFYMEAANDYCPASDSRAPEDLDMRKGDLLRVYRANNEWCEGLRLHDLHWGRFPTRHLCHAPPGGRREMDGAGLGEWLVQATHDFPGNESGELPLEKGDVVKVARQLAGWCEGKKLRGNQWGWFPHTHTQSMSTSRSSSMASSSRHGTMTSSHLPSPPPSPTPSSPISDLLLPPPRPSTPSR